MIRHQFTHRGRGGVRPSLFAIESARENVEACGPVSPDNDERKRSRTRQRFSDMETRMFLALDDYRRNAVPQNCAISPPDTSTDFRLSLGVSEANREGERLGLAEAYCPREQSALISWA